MAKVLLNFGKYIDSVTRVSGYKAKSTKFCSNLLERTFFNNISSLKVRSNSHTTILREPLVNAAKISSDITCGRFQIHLRGFSTGNLLLMRRGKKDRKSRLATAPLRDEGSEETKVDSGNLLLKGYGDISFPDEKTNGLIYDGSRFTDLPIIHIHVSKNNTIMTFSDAMGKTKFRRSCGIEGFKNAKKGTNIAAQATAITFGVKAIEQGYRNVRVKVNGLGPGRIAAVKGLTMAGLSVVCIADVTPIPFDIFPRPRKARR